ncbi:MAG TPA: D-aminoacylase [Candidatus Binatia bacterium]|jgi:N-acyl-D-aspartate/D-glutamate deacylase
MADAQVDVAIRGAMIYDGTGGAPFVGDVALTGDRIAAVAPGGATWRAAREIEARGLALAPGFVDVHSHDDLAVLLHPEMRFKVLQGVTTDVVGNCGLGAAPGVPAALLFQAFHPAHGLGDWEGYGGYMAAIEREPPSLNVAVLAGHGTLRLGAMERARGTPTAAELARMQALLGEALDAGVVGFTTGLIYEPGCFARPDEIVALARVAASAGALYATHMRNEAAGLLDSIRETLHVGEASGVAVQVSHHKAAGRDNWGRVRESLRLLEEARARGIDASADQYPYTSASTVLVAIVQNGVLDEHGTGGGLGRVGAERVLLASTPRHPEYEGMTLAEIARQRGSSARAAAEWLLEEDGTAATAVIEAMDEDDVRAVMAHPTTMIGSDGIPTLDGKPHPRLYGTFPRVLGHYARDLRVLPLAEAVHRMTGLPAAKFGLRDRGVVRAGAFADLVLFDPATVADTATYAEPHRYPAGIPHVFVNGTQVVRDGTHTGVRPGRVVRRQDRG